MLRNKKVFVDGLGKEIREKVFSMGNKWVGVGTIVSKPFYYFDEEGRMTQGSEYNYFLDHDNEKITAQEILDMKVEYELKTFDRVLVRDSDKSEWKGDIFSHMRKGEEYPFSCLGTIWRQAIPFEGNEDKLGKI